VCCVQVLAHRAKTDGGWFDWEQVPNEEKNEAQEIVLNNFKSNKNLLQKFAGKWANEVSSAVYVLCMVLCTDVCVLYTGVLHAIVAGIPACLPRTQEQGHSNISSWY
jgi:hypothetical protein